MKLSASIALSPRHDSEGEEITLLAAAADEYHIAHTFSDDSVYISDKNGKQIQQISDLTNRVRAITLTYGEIILGCEDGSILAYDMSSG